MIRKILVVFLLCSTVIVTAQRTSSSPYSFFGVGDEFSTTTVEQSSMGGIGVAFSHYKYLNFTNPAAIAELRYTTFGLGMLNNDLTVKTSTVEQQSTSTSLSYVTLAFPIGSKAGFSVGIQPVSSVGYSLLNTLTDDDGEITEISLFSGNGGINRIYGSLGIQVFKGFSLGIEADFNFGNIENSILNRRDGVVLATKYDEVLTVRGNTIKLGAQYKVQLKNKTNFNAGATVKVGNDLNVSGRDYLYSTVFSTTEFDIPKDTLSTSAISGAYNLPVKTTLGIGFGKFDKWYAGLEYENQDAITTTNLLGATNSSAYKYGASNRFSIGGFYIPKINSISSYWSRVTYRAGLRFEDTGLLVDGTGNTTNFTAIKDFGMSFGLGLPLKQLSTLNMGFEFGKRGSIENNLIQENYFNFRLSLSLSAFGQLRWFQKRKID
ncbi:hypothetical protein [uncultured Polaribacter sp.]|uniref:hypothetical protein n=1 Tax=uncultured Polaribacter sp. TaxID=174711 RepID=UPI002634986C|nr:hypothetical protein [uncultured Polaribacter sp.]